MIGALAMAAAIGLPPKEECGGDPGFDRVRVEFVAAVKARDAGRLAALASDDVKMDDEGFDKGPARLIEMMGEERGADFWRELEPVAESGCSAGENGRVLPYFATAFTGDEMLVAAAREPIRAGPSDKAKIKDYAKWEWVDHNFADSGPFYWHVRLRSGLTGYVRSERVYSNYSPYAAFEYRDGRWQLTLLRLVPAD